MQYDLHMMAIYDNYDVDYVTDEAKDADENDGGEFNDDDDKFYSDDFIDGDDKEGVSFDAGAGIETYMPTQGLPPLAMTGSIAATKQNCGLPFFYSFYVDHRGQIDPCSI